jgi:glycerophosphoryl diester phosphodiesterase
MPPLAIYLCVWLRRSQGNGERVPWQALFSTYRKGKFVTLVIGHKGAPLVEPENSVASFAAARRDGADGVELDVRRTGDGALAVWHDPVLEDGRILLDSSWPELADVLDDLAAVLDACAGMELVNVEIKNWPADQDFDATLGLADAVATAVAARRYDERKALVLSCFHPATLDRVREVLDDLAPDVRTARLMWGVADVEEVVTTAVEHGHAAVHPFFTAVTPDLITEAHAAGLAVNCWTCNDLDEIRRQADLGIDGIITDRPADAVRLLRG